MERMEQDTQGARERSITGPRTGTDGTTPAKITFGYATPQARVTISVAIEYPGSGRAASVAESFHVSVYDRSRQDHVDEAGRIARTLSTELLGRL
jgi:hypothetical protein